MSWSARTTGLTTLLVVLAGACRGEPRGPRRAGDEWVQAIEVEGNRALDDDQLVSGLALRRAQKRGTPADPYLIAVDADRIRGAYLRRGYLEVDVRSRVERAGDAATIVYAVDEGERARTEVVITGLPDDPTITAADVRAALPLADGAPFDYAAYEAAKAPILARVEEAGYAHVTLDARVVADRARGVATIHLAFDPGPKTTFGHIEITGVEGRLQEAVRARLRIAPGLPYSPSAIARTQRALYGMNRFAMVTVRPRKDGADPVVAVDVNVAEAARHEVKLGGGVGIDPASIEVRARTGYAIAGWPGPLDTTSVDLQPAYALLRDRPGYEPRIRALGRIARQDLLWTSSTGEVEAGYDYLNFEAYTAYGPRARLGVSTDLLEGRVRLRVGWLLRRSAFRNFNQLLDEATQVEIGVDQPARVGAYEQVIAVDLRDDPVATRFGAYGELRVSEGTQLAGGAFDFVEVIPELRGYVPLASVVLSARARVGVIFGDLAPLDRLFSGGASRQRGFSERKLAPSVFGLIDGDRRSVPYGGGALVETGIEARFPITTVRGTPVGGVAFLDGGDVTEDLDELDLGDLHWAAGLGLRVQTIVGPVRLDVGYRLNRTGPLEPSPGQRFAFHFSLGEAF